MRHLTLPVLAVLTLAAPTHAQGQDFFQSLENFANELVPRQQQAPRRAPEPVADETTPAEEAPPVPRPRPEGLGEEEAAAPVEDAEAVPPPPVVDAPKEEAPEDTVVEEEPEPARIYQTACPALLRGVIVGKMLPPISEGACGEQSPLEVTAVRVNGRELPLSSPVTTNCEMAGAFADWLGEVDGFASAALESPLAEVTTGTSMMCRNRVGGGDGFMSEHGFANALDITGFALEDGRSISVEADWLPASTLESRLLRQAHGAACGRFTTVLGPDANAEHEDHLHLDLGCHGQTCTAQICE